MIVPTAIVVTKRIKNLWAYILTNIPWELMLVVSAFLPTLLLHQSVEKLLRRLWNECTKGTGPMVH